MFVGRDDPRKGLDVLLDAMAALPGDVEVAVMGRDTEARARTHDDPRVRWLGEVSDDERRRRMRGATVACFPARGAESFGIVLAEAMAAGAAVVASDIPATATSSPTVSTACSSRSGTPISLAAALTRVLHDAPDRTALVAAGRRRAEQLSFDRLAVAYEALYRRLA